MRKIIFILFSIIFIFIGISYGANIVCIDNRTVRPGISRVNDIVEIQDDDVELSWGGYNNFKIISVKDINKADIMTILINNKLETMIDPNDLTTQYWFNPIDSKWYKVVNEPKYSFTCSNLTSQHILDLNDPNVSRDNKISILNRIIDNISQDPNNGFILRPRIR